MYYITSQLVKSFQSFTMMNKSTRQPQTNKRQLVVTFSCFLLATSCVLFVILQGATANAHSLMDNSIQTNEHNGHHSTQSNQQNKLVKNETNQNRCKSGWMWFNNKCWVTTNYRRDFSHAIEICRKMFNSTLPTIHSEDENEFLRQNVDLHNSPIWLNARHNHQYNQTSWLDKSTVNYTRWDAGQPSDKSSLICIKTDDNWYMKKAEPVDGQTECVSFWEDAKWGTQVGCLVLLPVVCEKKLTPVSRFKDGPNGTLTPSQYEQQQMFPVSSATSSSEFLIRESFLSLTYGVATISCMLTFLTNFAQLGL